MIITKTFKFTVRDVDTVILDIAEEIQKGYTFAGFAPVDVHSISADPLWRPTYEVTLRNKKADRYE